MLQVFRCFAFILRSSNIFLFVVGGRTKLFNTTPHLISLHSPFCCEIKKYVIEVLTEPTGKLYFEGQELSTI